MNKKKRLFNGTLFYLSQLCNEISYFMLFREKVKCNIIEKMLVKKMGIKKRGKLMEISFI